MPEKIPAKTVEEYLAALPPDRRAALEAIRGVIHANIDPAIEEGIQYRMIGCFVPHRVYPAGYHCNPKEPLPFAALASQKHHMSVSFFSLYEDCHGNPAPLLAWFRTEWARAGKKLDMGKCCIRFRKIEDVPLDVIAELLRKLPAMAFIEDYEAARRGE